MRCECRMQCISESNLNIDIDRTPKLVRQITFRRNPPREKSETRIKLRRTNRSPINMCGDYDDLESKKKKKRTGRPCVADFFILDFVYEQTTRTRITCKRESDGKSIRNSQISIGLQ